MKSRPSDVRRSLRQLVSASLTEKGKHVPGRYGRGLLLQREETMGTVRRSYYRIRNSAGRRNKARPVRILVLADLHNRVYRSDVPSLLKAIREEKCDLVLCAGDMVLMKGSHFETDQALSLIQTLSGKVPVYLVNGNHETRMKRRYAGEYLSYESALKKAGAVRLHNESADVSVKGMDLRITGLELDYRYFRNRFHKDLSTEEIEALVGESGKDRFQILLAHHPKYFPVYARWGADLTLSGHLHGGIVRLPWAGGVISPDPELFPRYDHGLYEKDGSNMIVSAGLGTHTINLRINNPAELVFVDLVP